MWPFSSSSWKQVTQDKQTARANAIEKVHKAIEASAAEVVDEEVYLHATASEIVRRIAGDEWTARAVVTAYIRQAIRAHAATNCLTEVRFEEALKEASDLDQEFATTKKIRGPLHGVPVSFKDQFDITGFDSSIGFTQWVNKPAEEDAPLVKQFRAAGAVVIAKTNVPQTMLSFECSNPLFGRSLNPYSDKHTCGGSSGGEAALLAMSGSALGVGSDIGGSLRIPAAYCGIYSLKPGPGRLSKVGARSANPGFEAFNSVVGPMARSVEDVELMCRSFFGGPGAPSEILPPTRYRDVTLPAKLRFGYYTSDLFVKASPACIRAVLETVEALRKKGHDCVEIDASLAPEAMALFAAITSADGYAQLLSHLGPDPKESSLFLVTLGPRLPTFLRNLVSWVASSVMHDKIFARTLDGARVKSVREFNNLIAKRDDLRKRWYAEIWARHNLDGIIAPVQASPALPHKATTTLSPLASGTILYNVIDSPAGVVPVTRVDPSKDKVTDEWTAGAGHGSRILEQGLYTKAPLVYDAEAMKGLPVGIQVVGKSWEEEKVVSMMKVVDEALGPRGFGPAAWKEGTKE